LPAALRQAPILAACDVGGEALLAALQDDEADAAHTETLGFDRFVKTLLNRVQDERRNLVLLCPDLQCVTASRNQIRYKTSGVP
jgi:hypothetical protein